MIHEKLSAQIMSGFVYRSEVLAEWKTTRKERFG